MHTDQARPDLQNSSLHFLWLELTSRCNLRCVHCYADSGPNPGTPDILTAAEYLKLIEDGAKLGCKRVQFIGGEPTLHRALPKLIESARGHDYEFVEVYTNAVRLSDELTRCFQVNHVAVATSFYCDDPTVHDAITGHNGSQGASIQTIRRLLDAGLSVRASIINLAANRARLPETIALLQGLGVRDVGIDRVRGVGRGAGLTRLGSPDIQELCGSCWRQSLCISPDGMASACIMSRAWPVGNAREMSLAAIVGSATLRDLRTRVYQEVWLPVIENTRLQEEHPGPALAQCAPCAPYQPCPPVKGCPPNPCLPNDCAPFAGPCGPVGSRAFYELS